MGQHENNYLAKIDDIDLQIIKILNEDGRTPFSQVAQRLGVSTGMVRQRYHRLVQEGVLQVVAVTNPLLMGFTTMAQIGVKVDVGHLEEIADQIASFEEVIYLVLLTGSYDLHIEIVCRDMAHLLDFLTNKLYSVAGIKDTETFICMRIAKEVYTWTGYLDAEQHLKASDNQK
jgi:Lrp/AsnC family transcriptional regulator for asnA, asnC and gidA